MNDLVSMNEAVKIIGVTRNVVTKAIKAGLLIAHRYGRRCLIERSSAEQHRDRHLKPGKRLHRELSASPPLFNEDTLITPTEAARIIGVTRQMMCFAVKNNKIETRQIGPFLLIPRRAAEYYRDHPRKGGRPRKGTI